MRCDEARPLISAGLDGELEGVRAVQLEAHLTDCAHCSVEREAMRATVQMLRALPETEPPAELRRRINVALRDAEGARPVHRAGLGWLVRPPAAGWAWGAALGAVVAAIAVVATRPQAPTVPLAVPSRPAATIAAAPPGADRAIIGPSLGMKVVLPLPRHAAANPRRENMPTRTAELPAAGKQPSPLPEVTAPLAPRPQASWSAAAISHAVHRRLHNVRPIVPPLSARRLVAEAPSVPGNSVPNRPERSNDDSSQLARTQSDPAPDPQTPAPSDPSAQDASTMTQMASGAGMPTSSETEADDLAELRHRLTDRPLQVPELGELKPAKAPRSGKDGWIRF